VIVGAVWRLFPWITTPCPTSARSPRVSRADRAAATSGRPRSARSLLGYLVDLISGAPPGMIALVLG